MKIAVLIDPAKAHKIPTVGDHLDAFRLHSKHEYSFFDGRTSSGPPPDLDSYDAIILHYTIRLFQVQRLGAAWVAPIINFKGPKIAFCQDEGESPTIINEFLHFLGINAVFSVMLPAARGRVYDGSYFYVYYALTGYVPDRLKSTGHCLPLAARKTMIGYRGNDLWPSFGKLGRDKTLIGLKMKDECEKRGITHDIEVNPTRKFDGNAWTRFLGSCRATLITEGGSSIFDNVGLLGPISNAYMQQYGWDKTYEMLRMYRYEDNGPYVGKISPKVFEAAALKTAIIAFPGKYSGILLPEHYIELKPDFSNIENVLTKLHDDDFVTELTERTYTDLVASGKYSYRVLASKVDDVLARLSG